MKTDKEKIIKHYEELLEYVEECNRFHVFNYYDSEYVETIKQKLKEMKAKENYDEIPVAACKHCHSLHIIEDEDSNNVCMKCGSVNDIIIYETIYSVPGHEKFKK